MPTPRFSIVSHLPDDPQSPSSQQNFAHTPSAVHVRPAAQCSPEELHVSHS
jgi:hypothetical protein